MRILFLAPLPPPITGQSVISKILLDELQKTWDVDAVDFGRASQHDGRVTISRLKAIARDLADVYRGQRRADSVYLTISESVTGNLRDILVCLLCVSRLRSMVIQLHGGQIGSAIYDRRPVLRLINGWFLRRMGGVIVSGTSHVSIFAPFFDRERIHIIPNFASPDVFVSEEVVSAKFAQLEPLRILFLSAMVPEKGYDLLVDAVLALPEVDRARLRVDFAGRFDSPAARSAFTERITGQRGITYHGMVEGDTKRTLFANAHVFCLPTMYFEGQPISILEAYASGCAVIASGRPGIRDVFAANVNGLEIVPGSVESLREALQVVIRERARLLAIAQHNWTVARRDFTMPAFNRAVGSVLRSAASV